jgi:hypothetical protein
MIFCWRVIHFYIWEVQGYKGILLIHPTHSKAYFLFGFTKGLHSPTLGFFISRYREIWEANLQPMRPMFQHLLIF